jgi:hypothetical protein
VTEGRAACAPLIFLSTILGDTFNSMREWLDQHNSVPMNFSSTVGTNDTVILHAVFDHTDEAAAFYKR